MFHLPVFQLLASVAFAGGPKLGVLEIPITPTDADREYMTLVKVPGADQTTWAPDADGFICETAGDYVEFIVRGAEWPSRIPTKVTCSDGRRSATAKVKLDRSRPEAAFVADGTLVLPRLKGNASIYDGAGPFDDFVVGRGSSQMLGLSCEVQVGGNIRVTASPDLADGEAKCSVRRKTGEVIWLT
ncbi:MAG: hypothetical protein HN348_24755, partial [Proteobacteria bacterium]|nr:hypothetical protein [Pseudomonadota bacterium]